MALTTFLLLQLATKSATAAATTALAFRLTISTHPRLLLEDQ